MGPRTDDTDEALLSRVAAGDRAAFSTLYRRHLNAVIAYARRRMPEPDLAFDVAAETWAAVAVGAAGYDGRGPAIGWIFGIARNQLATAMRRLQVEDSARRQLGCEPITLTDADLERVEDRASAGSVALEAALTRLPDGVRQALLA